MAKDCKAMWQGRVRPQQSNLLHKAICCWKRCLLFSQQGRPSKKVESFLACLDKAQARNVVWRYITHA